jgi:hypothetical protein
MSGSAGNFSFNGGPVASRMTKNMASAMANGVPDGIITDRAFGTARSGDVAKCLGNLIRGRL